MSLRLHRVSDDQWQLRAALRRTRDIETAPARTEIGAIEIELRELRIDELGDKRATVR
jgi:hypothetical protein